jgi:CheY-like chemotaxis protein
VASNGEEAVSTIKSRPFDMILMDVQMPVMDGYEATKKIREYEDNITHTPIIAMTAFAMTEDIQKSKEVGMDDHITKPIEPDRLFEIVEHIIAGEKTTRPEEIGESSGTGLSSDEVIESTTKTRPVKTRRVKDVPVLNVDTALPLFGNDLSFYKEFLDEFMQTLPGKLHEIKTNFEVGDMTELARKSHNLKGVSANLGALKLSTCAHKLDLQASLGEEKLVEETIAEMEQLIKQLKSTVAETG